LTTKTHTLNISITRSPIETLACHPESGPACILRASKIILWICVAEGPVLEKDLIDALLEDAISSSSVSLLSSCRVIGPKICEWRYLDL